MTQKASKLSIILLSTGLTVGCASQSDLDRLQAEVDKLKADVAAVNTTAEEAAAASAAALAAAESAQASATEANMRIDRMFKRAQMK